MTLYARNSSWLGRGAGCLLLVVPFLLGLATVRSRGIDPDELEHLHAAFCVSRGMVPYRDFFEHHSPGLYYLMQPAFWIHGPELDVLWLGRVVMCTMSLATLLITWRLAKDLKGETAAWTASLLLVWSTVFVQKGAELRPDVPAGLCLAVMTYFAAYAYASNRFACWSAIGLVGGFATLFTQKSIVPVVSLAVSLTLSRWVCHLPNKDQPLGASTTTPQSSIKLTPYEVILPILGIGFGGAVVWGLVAIVFTRFGALQEMFRGTVLQLLSLPIQSSRWEHLRPTFAADLTLWAAGSWGLITVCHDLYRRNSDRLLLFVMGTLAGCLLSLAWVKAIYPQYVLLWLPLLAISAAIGLDRLRETTGSKLAYLVIAAGLVVFVIESKLLFDGLRGAHVSALSHLRNLWNDYHIPAIAVLILPAGLVLWAGYLFRFGIGSHKFLVPLAILGMSYAIARDANNWLWSNRQQVKLVNRVNSLVHLNETVLDGFAGYGALRPHANYFWWINRYSLALMSDNDKSNLLRHFQEHPPAVVLYDRELRSWPEIRPLVEASFWPTPEPPIWIHRPD